MHHAPCLVRTPRCVSVVLSVAVSVVVYLALCKSQVIHHRKVNPSVVPHSIHDTRPHGEDGVHVTPSLLASEGNPSSAAVGTATKCSDSFSQQVWHPLIGLGTGGYDDDAAYAATLKALRLGYRLIDTAIDYNNERGIGRALKHSGIRREDVFVLTKCCANACSMSAEGVYRQFNESLNRLGIDYVDGYLLHVPGEIGRWDSHLMVNLDNHELVYNICSEKSNDYARTNKQRRRESWLALETLQREGRVKHIGVSNFKIHHLQDILQVASSPPTMNQIEWHPNFHDDLLREFCLNHNMSILAYGSLNYGSGTESNDILSELGKKYGMAASQVSLRWAMQQGIPVIPRSSSAHHLRENMRSIDFDLSPEDMRTICKLSEQHEHCTYCADFPNMD
jgi:diketogulonate reductase-like aldo/keto reductase